MKKFWRLIGTICFWVAWPALFIFIYKTTRTRVVIVAKNKVLVTKGWLGAGKWSLPGGGIHVQENPIDGALRELKEETGLVLSADQLKHFWKGRINDSGLHCNAVAFGVQLANPAEVQIIGPEIIEVAWIPLEELTSQNAAKDALQLVTAWIGRSNLVE